MGGAVILFLGVGLLVAISKRDGSEQLEEQAAQGVENGNRRSTTEAAAMPSVRILAATGLILLLALWLYTDVLVFAVAAASRARHAAICRWKASFEGVARIAGGLPTDKD